MANMLRIFGIAVVANYWNAELAGGKIHDISGYALFAVAFGLLYLTGKLLDFIFPDEKK